MSGNCALSHRTVIVSRLFARQLESRAYLLSSIALIVLSHLLIVFRYKFFLSSSPLAGSIGSITVRVTLGNLNSGWRGERVFVAPSIYTGTMGVLFSTLNKPAPMRGCIILPVLVRAPSGKMQTAMPRLRPCEASLSESPDVLLVPVSIILIG